MHVTGGLRDIFSVRQLGSENLSLGAENSETLTRGKTVRAAGLRQREPCRFRSGKRGVEH